MNTAQLILYCLGILTACYFTGGALSRIVKAIETHIVMRRIGKTIMCEPCEIDTHGACRKYWCRCIKCYSN